MAVDRAPLLDRQLLDGLDRLAARPAPRPLYLDAPIRADSTLTARAAIALFDAQAASRHLDLAARALRARGEGFYTIGSSGHEGNAAVAAALRPTDPAFLHYRSGAFFVACAAQVPGQTPLHDILLGLCASTDDPIAAVHPDGTFDIAYDDGDFEAHVPVDRISPLDGAAAASPTTTTTTASDGRRSQREPRGYPYGIGVALQYDYYNAYGLYDGLLPADRVRNSLSNHGLSAAVDHDARRAVRKPEEKAGVLPDLAKLVGGGRAMVGKVTDHGVEFDVNGWLGYRLGFVMASITPMVGVGADGVGLNSNQIDGGFPTAGYWFIGASLNGERSSVFDAGYDLTFVRIGRVGDDVVDSEVRVSTSFSIHGWFAGANINFYGGLGITTLMAGKRF